MKGQDIEHIFTIQGYNNNAVEVIAKGGYYLLRAEDILKMVNEFNFKEVKKRKHTYLEVEL